MTTGTDVILNARDILQDTVTGAFRYSDVSLYRAFNVGLQEMKRMRPDAYLKQGKIQPVPIIDATTVAATLPVDDMFASALIYFVAGYAELREDQFTQDGRASALIIQARNLLMAA